MSAAAHFTSLNSTKATIVISCVQGTQVIVKQFTSECTIKLIHIEAHIQSSSVCAVVARHSLFVQAGKLQGTVW